MKILNLKYKMHKLVNYIFYLIIFIFGFLLGFCIEKINFNKLISEFLFIENVSAEELSCTETENLFVKEELLNNVITNGAPTNITFNKDSIIIYSSIFYSGANFFIDLEPGTYTFSVDSIVGGHNAIQMIKIVNNEDGTTSTEWYGGLYGGVPQTFEFTEKTRFQLRFYNTLDKSSFTTTYTNVSIVGKICNKDVMVDVVNDSFYSFSQKILGDVGEENYFIYDFITFGLVSVCFILMILIIGFIMKKFFGG